MEVIFDNLSSNDKKLSQVSLNINSGSFSAISGISINTFRDLLLMNKRPSSGSLTIDGVVVKRTNKVVSYDKIRRKIAFLSEVFFSNYDDYVVNDIFLAYFDEYKLKIEDKNKHIVDSLKFVGYGKSILKRKFSELSFNERKMIMLSCILSVNPSLIVLDQFEKGLIFRDRENYKKLFIKLKNKFNKTFIFVNSSIDFVMGYVDNIIVINNGKSVYVGDKKSFYNDKIYKYMDMPKIISFTKQIKSKGHDIIEYTDIKELLKELYRKIK